MKKRNIIIDCDPGIDDAVAISLAYAFEDKLNILGITTVAGNQTIEKVTSNALRLTSFLGRDTKVARGVDSALIRKRKVAKQVHGETGMGNFVLPETNNKLYSENAVLFMKEAIEKADGKVTICPIGPLTNIALLIKMFPEVKEKIELLSIMGGAAFGGNVTATAEFNVWADPEAARIVFDSGLPIVMSGLDVTHSIGFTRDDVNELMKSKGKITSFCGEIIDFYFNGDAVNGGTFTPIHDASAIMYLLHPELYTFKHMAVTVDCSEETNRGFTACDTREWMHYDESYPKILLGVDTDKFKEIMLEALYRLDKEFV